MVEGQMMSNDATISIVIGGDTVPVGDGLPLFESGKAESLVDDVLLGTIYDADYGVFNLEAPLANDPTPIVKCGANLIAPTMSVLGLAAINPFAFGLANNHVLDQGASGLNSTIATLDAAGASWFGAGRNLSEASKPLVFEKDGMSVGFYACAEHEFTIAGENSPGANPYDPLESFGHVKNLKDTCDYVVVLFHGGKEFYRYPSPQQQRICRKFADEGADLVVCQHSHCVGCKEDWNGSTIVYGQGNFLFDRGDDEFWQTGLLLRVKLTTQKADIEFVPIKKSGVGVRQAGGSEARGIISEFEERSRQIVETGFVEREYGKFASRMLGQYLPYFYPSVVSFPYRVLNRLSGRRLQRMLTNEKSVLPQINYIECEAHHELLLAGLKGVLKRGCAE